MTNASIPTPGPWQVDRQDGLTFIRLKWGFNGAEHDKKILLSPRCLDISFRSTDPVSAPQIGNKKDQNVFSVADTMISVKNGEKHLPLVALFLGVIAVILGCVALWRLEHPLAEIASCGFGQANRVTMAGTLGFYDIMVPDFPDTVLLSRQRNAGSSSEDIELTSTGLMVHAGGNYLVAASVIVVNPEPTTRIIVCFVVQNNEFDFERDSAVPIFIAMTPGDIQQRASTGILPEVPPDTHLSLRCSNAAGGGPAIVTVVAWSISATALDCPVE